MGHPRALMDDKRRKKIRDALKLGYSESDLCAAIHGCSLTPWNMGDNPAGQRYDDLTLILRDADHIDRFIRHAENPPAPKTKGASRIEQSNDETREWHDERMRRAHAQSQPTASREA